MKHESSVPGLRVEVKHRGAPRKRYTWELHYEARALPVKESSGTFASWEEASQAGKLALSEYLHA